MGTLKESATSPYLDLQSGRITMAGEPVVEVDPAGELLEVDSNDADSAIDDMSVV